MNNTSSRNQIKFAKKTMMITEQGDYNIYFDSYHCYTTYAGLIAGLPSSIFNKKLIERMYKNVERALGTCKIYLIEPKVAIRKNRPYLPRYINAVRLYSGPIHDKADGSMLIVVWFGDTMSNNLMQATTDVVNKISWAELADDFYF